MASTDVSLTPADRETLLRAAARRARDAHSAWRYLRPLGFPREALPAWTENSEIWWELVFDELDLGRVPNPYPKLISLLFGAYRADADLYRLHQRYVRQAQPAEPDSEKPDVEPAVSTTGAYVFVSYSHGIDDSAYVEDLAEHLTRAGVAVWFDREIIAGDRWERVITTRIDACAALLVVMTPRSEKSSWVSREIYYAEAKKKPIFPLLLDGAPFFGLSDIQYEDVTGGRMPSARFAAALRALN